jgi:hypothetical protein
MGDLGKPVVAVPARFRAFYSTAVPFPEAVKCKFFLVERL